MVIRCIAATKDCIAARKATHWRKSPHRGKSCIAAKTQSNCVQKDHHGGTRPFKKGMVQWENTDRNDTVNNVWTRHMIQMDLEPDAI